MTLVYAMGQSGAGAEGAAPSPGGMLVPMILMFVIFYFLLIRPQQKKNKEHREMINNIKKGDRVITTGGIHGRVAGVADNILTLEIADKVKIKLNRGSIAGLAQAAPQSQPAKKDKDTKSETDVEKSENE